MTLAQMRKALMAGALSALATVLSFNIPGWIDGTVTFDWRSVVAGVVAAYIVGFHTYLISNAVPPFAAPVVPAAPPAPTSMVASSLSTAAPAPEGGSADPIPTA